MSFSLSLQQLTTIYQALRYIQNCYQDGKGDVSTEWLKRTEPVLSKIERRIQKLNSAEPQAMSDPLPLLDGSIWEEA